jgi:serine/threonine protein kinase
MTPTQFRRARDLFEGALKRDPEDVNDWLTAEEPSDAEVRAEVQSLLDHHARAGAFLTQPIAEVAPHLLEEEQTLAPGSVLGTYTVIRELGRGGMGRVYLATDRRLGRTVALKALAPHLTRDPIHRDRFRREARAAAVLTHPGICTVYALEEFDGELYIVTEFVDGHTLRDEVIGKRPTPDIIVNSGRELAAALASAHAKGITHRDLKPENVMRQRDGRLKILDFGLARVEGDAGTAATLTATGAGPTAGTPAYMAPEQVEGRHISPATDVFAFGVVMYEWIGGVHPFHAASSLAMLARVMDSHPDSLTARSDVPWFVSDIVDRCLKKSPADRFSSAVELCEAFDRPVTVRRTSGSRAWWRIHQIVTMALYIVATARAWQIKEWLHGSASLWAFVLIGVAASLGGIVRGHLIFTDVMNQPQLPAELRRTRRTVLAADVLLAATLLTDALLVAQLEPLAAVFTIGVAVGIALASILMEPATTSAVFGHV